MNYCLKLLSAILKSLLLFLCIEEMHYLVDLGYSETYLNVLFFIERYAGVFRG